ncbi:DUF1552 domain-containing protein [Bdellovibrio sp. HCB185ZH]|uniref:DUF1552 domain-containing protein n=1 Tax=Bdellovibrio sp. HCB185ZH TaxID=3394235 RepID=UPI0039A46B29
MSQKIDRRRFLISAGSLIALPMFESLWPTQVLAQVASAPNVIFLKFPLGVIKNSWRPSGSGTSYTLPSALSMLEPVKGDLIFPTGLHNFCPVNGIHASSNAAFLTGTEPLDGGLRVGQSIDRLIAEKLSLTASPRTIQITAADASDSDTGSGFNYSSTYGTNISWINATTPASSYNTPAAVFKAIFPSGVGSGATPTPTPSPTGSGNIANYRKNILDNAVGEIGVLKSKLGASDKAKLDQYLTGLDEVQKKIATVTPPVTTPPATSNACVAGTMNLNPNKYDIDAFTDTNLEIIKLAIACGQSRIISYHLDYEYGSHFPVQMHSISHYNDDPRFRTQYEALNKKWAEKFLLLINKLKSVTDGTGKTLFDNTIIVIGSGLNDGQGHGSTDLPIIVAGRGGGLKPGKVVSTNAPLSNLWISVARYMGVNVSQFGRSTGDLGI